MERAASSLGANVRASDRPEHGRLCDLPPPTDVRDVVADMAICGIAPYVTPHCGTARARDRVGVLCAHADSTPKVSDKKTWEVLRVECHFALARPKTDPNGRKNPRTLHCWLCASCAETPVVVMGVHVGPGLAWTAPPDRRSCSTGGTSAAAERAFGRAYDVSPRGRRFLMINANEDTEQSATPLSVIVQKWTEKLKRLVPTR